MVWIIVSVVRCLLEKAECSVALAEAVIDHPSRPHVIGCSELEVLYQQDDLGNNYGLLHKVQ